LPGSAENVIPDTAEAGGTLRALEPEDRERLREAALEMVEATARAHGCAARVEVTEGEPATVNDPALSASVRARLPEAGFALASPMRSCGSDDFGFYGRLAPALMVFVGLDGALNTKPFPCTTPASCPARSGGGGRPRSGRGPGRRLRSLTRKSNQLKR
jgi:metal-dependent amidase/aminoacylase/carboxypeptidase family protein